MFNYLRPVMDAIYIKSISSFGKIIDEFSLCNPYLKIYDKFKNIRWIIVGAGLQCKEMCCQQVPKSGVLGGAQLT